MKDCANDYVLALGLFDAMHIGHRYLIAKAKKYAREHNYQFLLLTFDDKYFNFIHKKDKSIYTLAERKLLMQKLDVNYFAIDCSSEFFRLSDIGFYRYLSSFSPKAIFIGSDYTFGAKGKWTAQDMLSYYESKDIMVNIVDLVSDGNKKISTSHIKTLLSSGEIEKANKLLGTDYFVLGKVVTGKRVGRTMGLPTANLCITSNKFLPKWGVYASLVEVEGKYYKGLTNVGAQPTFANSMPCVETHILDFDKDIYGKEIIVSFKHFLRSSQPFESLEQLKQQILTDIKKVRALW